MKREIRKYEAIVERWRRREERFRGHETHSHIATIAGRMADAIEKVIAESGPMVEAHEKAVVEADRLRMEAEAEARKEKKAALQAAEKEEAAILAAEEKAILDAAKEDDGT